MANQYKIDKLDRKIISLLMQNARMPFLEVARECGISGAAVHQRVQKLEDANVLTGSRFIVGQKALGYNTCAYVGVHLEKASMYTKVQECLEQIPEVVECHYTTGNYALFLKIYTRDNEHLMELLNEIIQNIPGVSSTETFISLRQSIDRQVVIGGN